MVMSMWKKVKSSLAVALCLILVLQVAGCGSGSGGSGDTAWKYDKIIKEPIKAQAGGGGATVGSLGTAAAEVKISGKAFDGPTAVTLVSPDQVPKVMGKAFTPVGSPIAISAGETEVRMNEPVMVTLKLDEKAYGESAKQPGDFYAAYYNGQKWEYIKPTKVDLKAGTLTFQTYHFCLFGAGKLSVEEQVSKFVRSKAVGEWAQENVDKRMEDASNKLIDHILVQKLGIKDESIKMKVIGNLLKNDEWGDLVKKAKEGDVTGVNETMQVLVGKTIVDFVPKSTLSKALEGTTSNLGLETAKKAAEAAGYLAEGDYRGAAQILGTHIADQFMFTQVARIAIAATQYKIDTWKNEELEAAYQAFKNGASSKVPFWGYQVEKGNFEDVWSQMKGAARQVEIDAIAAQEAIRREAGMPPLTDKEKNNIREAARSALEDEFNRRIEEDKAIAEKEAALKELVDQYKNAKLLTPGEWGYPSDYYSVEQRLDELTHLRDKVLRDTGRDDLTNGAFSTKEKISYADLVALTMAWYTKPDGNIKYAEMIKDKFGIDLFPKVEEVNGKWKGSFTITDVKFPPAPEKKPDAAAANPDDPLAGCDIGIPIEELLKELEKVKGKPFPATYSFKLDAKGAGTMSLISGDNVTPMSATYSFGKLQAKLVQKDQTATFTGLITKEDKLLKLNGKWEMPFAVKGASQWYGLKGTFTATKEPAPPAKAPAGKQAPAVPKK